MITLNKYLTESLTINEAFKAQILRDMAEYIKGHENQYKKGWDGATKLVVALTGHGKDTLIFPRGIQWDKVTDDDIVFGFADEYRELSGVGNDADAKKRCVISDSKWITLWIHPGTLATFLSCGQHVYSIGTYDSPTLRNERPRISATRDELLVNNDIFDPGREPSRMFFPQSTVTVNKLLNKNIRYFCISIPKKTILKLSTINLVKDRFRARQGATALMSDDEIRNNNINRYKIELSKMRANNPSIKPYMVKASKIVDEYKEMQSEVEEMRNSVLAIRDKNLADALKGIGLDDEAYMSLFMGVGEKMETLRNSDNLANGAYENAEYHLRNAGKHVNDVMKGIKDLINLFQDKDTDTESRARELRFWDSEFESFDKKIKEIHAKITGEITKVKSAIKNL